MRQAHTLAHTCLPARQTRRKHCKYCGALFEPDPRTQGKQRYCSKSACQTQRQRLNELNWRTKNPDCLQEQYERSRLWHKARPDYSRQRRTANPEFAQENRDQTKARMQKIRGKRVFDKSKSILTQIVGGKPDKCYLAQGSKWLMVRLTKASPLSKPGSVWDNRKQLEHAANCLPRGRLYELSGIF